VSMAVFFVVIYTQDMLGVGKLAYPVFGGSF
jgi:hypothetical protein